MSIFRLQTENKQSKRFINVLIFVAFVLVWANVAHSAHVGFVDGELVEIDCSVCHFSGSIPDESLLAEPPFLAFFNQKSNYQFIIAFDNKSFIATPLRAPPKVTR